jgi:hypothetical protein
MSLNQQINIKQRNNQARLNLLPNDKRLNIKPTNIKKQVNTNTNTNNLFAEFNSINTLSNDVIGIAGYPLVVRNKTGEYIYKIVLDDTNNANNANTNSFYEYNILKMLNQINIDNPLLNLPIIKVYNYKRMKKESIISKLSNSNLVNKEAVLSKLDIVFKEKKTSNELMGIYRMEKVNGKSYIEILNNENYKNVLQILFEQYYVLLQIRKKYPNFIHNDLHLYNLIIKENDTPKDKSFTLNGIKYSLKNVKYTPYMIDFDQSIIDGIVNKKSMEQLKNRDNNFDEYYLTLHTVIHYFNILASYIRSDIDIKQIRSRYKGLKKIDNKLYHGYEIMIYIYLYNFFNEYIYDTEKHIFINKKGINNAQIDNIIELFNSVNKIYNVFIMIISQYLNTHHIQFMYSKSVAKSLVDIINKYYNNAVEIYKYIYKLSDMPSFLKLPDELVKYINGNREKAYIDNETILKNIFAPILSVEVEPTVNG